MAKLPYEVTIYGADNGYIIRAGCKMLVFLKAADMLKELTEYLDNPSVVVSKYLSEDRVDFAPQTNITGSPTAGQFLGGMGSFPQGQPFPG